MNTVSYQDATAAVQVDLSYGKSQDTKGAGTDTIKNCANLIGGQFNDTLLGSALANAIEGGAGSDRIFGDKGADALTGGAGADVFVFGNINQSNAASEDVIRDFSAAQGDKIDLRSFDADATTAGFQHFSFAADGVLGLGKVIFLGGEILGDVTGDGVEDFVARVTGAVLGAGDFLL